MPIKKIEENKIFTDLDIENFRELKSQLGSVIAILSADSISIESAKKILTDNHYSENFFLFTENDFFHRRI